MNTSTLLLTDADRSTLLNLLRRGKTAARILTRARILLKLAEGWADAAIADALDTSRPTVARVRRRFTEGGVAAVIQDKPQRGRPHALTPTQTAHLVAIACTPAPAGHDHWTVRLLAGKVVELGFVASISPETIRQALKKAI